LPGGPGFGAQYMRGDAELFADTLQSYLVDPHGSGQSTPPSNPSGYSPEGHAAFYEDVRRVLGLDRVLVFGHSFGATTALAYSALYPEAVVGCVAVAPFGIGWESWANEAKGAAAEVERGLARHSGTAWYGEARSTWDAWSELVLGTDDPLEVERMMARVLPLYTAYPDRPDVAAALVTMAQYLTTDLAAAKAWAGGLSRTIDVRPLLAKVACPTLVIAGELDCLCGPAQARPISAAISDVRLEVLADCGHIPCVESRVAYRDAVSKFVSV
jgi:proline iminopeptidase